MFLGQGSQVIGAVNLGGGTDSVTATGNGISTRVLTINAENIAVASGVAGLVSGGDTIHTIDPTSVASLTVGTNNLINTVSASIHGQVSEGHNAEDQKGQVWGKFFNSSFERNADSNQLAYDHDHHGVIFGYGLGANSGMMLGFGNGKIDTRSESFQSDVSSVFTGYYKGFEIADSTFINTNIMAGYEKYKNRRAVVDNVNGIETAKSDLNNFFISPSIEIEHRMALHKNFELRPNASANYNASFFGSTKESGTTASNIAIESRNARVLNAKAGVLGVLTLLENYKLHLGFGVDSRSVSEGKANVEIAGSATNFATNNDKSVNGRYIHLGVNFVDSDDMALGMEVRKRSADGGEDQKSIRFNAAYKF